MDHDKMGALLGAIYREGLDEGGVESVTVALKLADGSRIYFRCDDRWNTRTDLVGPNGVLVGELPRMVTSPEAADAESLAIKVRKLEMELSMERVSASEDYESASKWRKLQEQVKEGTAIVLYGMIQKGEVS